MVCNRHDIVFTDDEYECERKRTEANGSERKRTEANGNERKRTEANGSKRKRTEANGSERKRTEANGSERKRTEANGSERKRTEANGRRGMLRELTLYRRNARSGEAASGSIGPINGRALESRPIRDALNVHLFRGNYASKVLLSAERPKRRSWAIQVNNMRGPGALANQSISFSCRLTSHVDRLPQHHLHPLDVVPIPQWAVLLLVHRPTHSTQLLQHCTQLLQHCTHLTNLTRVVYRYGKKRMNRFFDSV